MLELAERREQVVRLLLERGGKCPVREIAAAIPGSDARTFDFYWFKGRGPTIALTARGRAAARELPPPNAEPPMTEAVNGTHRASLVNGTARPPLKGSGTGAVLGYFAELQGAGTWAVLRGYFKPDGIWDRWLVAGGFSSEADATRLAARLAQENAALVDALHGASTGSSSWEGIAKRGSTRDLLHATLCRLEQTDELQRRVERLEAKASKPPPNGEIMATVEQWCDATLVKEIGPGLRQALRDILSGKAIGRRCKASEILAVIRRRVGPRSFLNTTVAAYLKALERDEPRSKDADDSHTD